jgi:hypothetical protein
VVQFGTDHPDVSAGLKPTVSQLATDHTVAVQERAKVSMRNIRWTLMLGETLPIKT